MKNSLLLPMLLLIFLLILTSPGICDTTKPAGIVDTLHILHLGDTPVKLRQICHNPGPVVYFRPHGNEEIARLALLSHLKNHKGTGFIIMNPERNLTFRYRERHYRIDPNRIFTEKGIDNSLETLNSLSQSEKAELVPVVSDFSNKLIKLMTGQDLSGIKAFIAVHNNWDGYEGDGKDGKGNISGDLAGDKYRHMEPPIVHLGEGADPDDLFWVTRKSDFHYLRKSEPPWKGGHVVILDPYAATGDEKYNDGSASVFFFTRNIPYFNVEVEHGPGIRSDSERQKIQEAMLRAVDEILNP